MAGHRRAGQLGVGAGLLLMALAFAGALAGQAPVGIPEPTVNPPGVALTLQLPNGSTVRQYEAVRATLDFRVHGKEPSREPGSAMWRLVGVLVDPPWQRGMSACGDIRHPCSQSGVYLGAEFLVWGGEQAARPNPTVCWLTEYLPRLSAGRYRVAAVVERAPERRLPGAALEMPRYPSRVLAVSNFVEITVTPANSAWIGETITGAVATLTAAPSDDWEEDRRRRQAAIHQLNLLDDPRAWDAFASIPPEFQGELVATLSRSDRPAEACAWMQAGLDRATQRVNSSYLHALSSVCARAQSAPPAAMLEWMAAGRRTPPPPEAEQYGQRLMALQGEVREAAYERLLASLSRREGQHLVDAMATLLGAIPQSGQAENGGTGQAPFRRAQTSGRVFGMIATGPPTGAVAPPGEAAPAWVTSFRAEFAQLLPRVTDPQRSLLVEQAVLKGIFGNGESQVESELDGWRPGDDVTGPATLLRLLHGRNPEQAHRRIRMELNREQTWLRPADLELLPADPPPFSDEELVSLLEAHPAEESAALWEMAVVRYATAAAAGRIRQIYEQRLPACQPVLVAYFVRADPEYAGSLFGHRWDMLQNPPPCTISIFRTTPAFAMGPVLERYLTAYLFHRGVSLKDAAATSLSRYGSAAARDPLWEAFRHFHRYWKGREEALAQNHEGVHFEFTLRRSIAHGRKWVTSKQDLETLAALCITARCREETQRELQAWQDAVAVRAMGSAASFYGQAAHYSELRSLEELLAKVRQFPAGTRIRIAVGGGQALEWEDRIRRAAQEAGLTVAP